MAENNSAQIINSERAVGTILSNFGSDFIMDVIDDNLKMKFRPFHSGSPNYVNILEQQFNMTKTMNPAYIDQIEEKRSTTYREIINRICTSYNLLFVGEQNNELNPNELYNIAAVLYDVFITNFTERMINFFVTYIVSNKEDIYKTIDGAEEYKKNKEITAYGRKIYTDSMLVVIHGNLNSVLDNIAGHDIPMTVLLTYLTDPNIASYLSTILQDAGDLYKYHYGSYIINPSTRAELFTAIKLSMQSIASDKAIDPNQFVTN